MGVCSSKSKRKYQEKQEVTVVATQNHRHRHNYDNCIVVNDYHVGNRNETNNYSPSAPKAIKQNNDRAVRRRSPSPEETPIHPFLSGRNN